MTTIGPYTIAVIPLHIYYDQEILGHATGFIWKNLNSYYVISNWHVFSGRDPNTNQPKHRDGALPNRIVALCHARNSIGSIVPVSIKLTSDDGSSSWLEHGSYGREIDVEALPFIENSPHIRGLVGTPPVSIVPINTLPQHMDAKIEIGQDVFVIGFPLGLKQQANFPIWKRASIASEIDLDYNDLPSLLIDTATREGMSGAPVIWRTYGHYRSHHTTMQVTGGAVSQFIGLYSGRNIAKNLSEAQLGIVWRPECISDIIEQGVPGSNAMK